MSGKIELKVWTLVAVVLSAVVLGFVGVYVAMPEESAVSRAYQTLFYVTNGGDKAVVASGGEIEVQSGGILDLQSGASITATAGVDLNGGTLTWDADADTTSVASDDDVISTTIGTSTGVFKILEPDGTARFTVDGYGQVVFTPEADEVAGNYNEWVMINGYMTGTGTKDRNYGLTIEMTRPAGQELVSGDHDEAALKIRIDTEATTTTAGTVLRGIDAEAKADNPSGTVTNLYGGSFTAKSDSGAGATANMIALTANTHTGTQANAVTGILAAGDFRIARFSPTEPTEEFVLHLRSASEAGTGADAAIYVESDFSGETDDFNYGIDMSAADIDNADIRFQNGTVLEETVDTVLTFGEFLAAEEQTAEVVTEGSTIVATGTYQPITSAGAVTTSTSTAIADGTQVGQLLILVNENASDTITIDDGANTRLSGNAVLGNDDSLMLIWDGADWLEIGQVDTT